MATILRVVGGTHREAMLKRDLLKLLPGVDALGHVWLKKVVAFLESAAVERFVKFSFLVGQGANEEKAAAFVRKYEIGDGSEFKPKVRGRTVRRSP